MSACLIVNSGLMDGEKYPRKEKKRQNRTEQITHKNRGRLPSSNYIAGDISQILQGNGPQHIERNILSPRPAYLGRRAANGPSCHELCNTTGTHASVLCRAKIGEAQKVICNSCENPQHGPFLDPHRITIRQINSGQGDPTNLCRL